MSGARRPITRSHVASEIPFASALPRNASRHCSKAGGVARAVAGLGSSAPATNADRNSARRVHGESRCFIRAFYSRGTGKAGIVLRKLMEGDLHGRRNAKGPEDRGQTFPSGPSPRHGVAEDALSGLRGQNPVV